MRYDCDRKDGCRGTCLHVVAELPGQHVREAHHGARGARVAGGERGPARLPHVRDDDTEEGAVEAKPAVLRRPPLLQGEISLARLVVVVHLTTSGESGNTCVRIIK